MTTATSVTKVTIKCPHCGKDSEIFRKGYDALWDQWNQLCEHCGKEFVGTDTHKYTAYKVGEAPIN